MDPRNAGGSTSKAHTIAVRVGSKLYANYSPVLSLELSYINEVQTMAVCGFKKSSICRLLCSIQLLRETLTVGGQQVKVISAPHQTHLRLLRAM